MNNRLPTIDQLMTFRLELLCDITFLIGCCMQQCDQMSKKFVQYFVIDNNENNAQWQKMAKVCSKFCRIITKPSKNCRKLLKLTQGGDISPNLVTLVASRMTILTNQRALFHRKALTIVNVISCWVSSPEYVAT